MRSTFLSKRGRTIRPLTRGHRMTVGKGWRLVNVRGRSAFVGTLLATVNLGGKRMAIFSVWKER